MLFDYYLSLQNFYKYLVEKTCLLFVLISNIWNRIKREIYPINLCNYNVASFAYVIDLSGERLKERWVTRPGDFLLLFCSLHWIINNYWIFFGLVHEPLLKLIVSYISYDNVILPATVTNLYTPSDVISERKRQGVEWQYESRIRCQSQREYKEVKKTWLRNPGRQRRRL